MLDNANLLLFLGFWREWVCLGYCLGGWLLQDWCLEMKVTSQKGGCCVWVFSRTRAHYSNSYLFAFTTFTALLRVFINGMLFLLVVFLCFVLSFRLFSMHFYFFFMNIVPITFLIRCVSFVYGGFCEGCESKKIKTAVTRARESRLLVSFLRTVSEPKEHCKIFSDGRKINSDICWRMSEFFMKVLEMIGRNLGCFLRFCA